MSTSLDQPNATPRPILIAGPTASGKSAMAVEFAMATGGLIVNADSQQVYREWRVLTARPTPEEEAQAPHRLYGHISLMAEYSVGHWLRHVASVLADAKKARQPVIVVGGTGLYFRALTQGLAEIPTIPEDIRMHGEGELDRLGIAAFAEEFTRRDPKTAATTDLANPRRVLRAWEVLEATGKGLAEWRAETPPALVPLSEAKAIALVPPRDWLYVRCDARFDQMLADGALEEVRAVLDGAPPRDLKAVGARELKAYLHGTITLATATESAKTETRRYAKRQLTWIRNQMGAWPKLDPTNADEMRRFRACTN